MSETNHDGLTTEFQARIRDFTDMMLQRLRAVINGKDIDDKEARVMGSLILKTLKLWDQALAKGRLDPRQLETLRRIEKQSLADKS